jgi:hypothetical protein
VRKITGQALAMPRSSRRSNSARPLSAGHAHVQQDAGRRLGRRGIQRLLEGAGAVEALRRQPARAQQPGQRLAHLGIVVDDVDHGIGGGHAPILGSPVPEPAKP